MAVGVLWLDHTRQAMSEALDLPGLVVLSLQLTTASNWRKISS